MAAYHHGNDLIAAEELAAGGVTNEMARRWMELSHLQVRSTLWCGVVLCCTRFQSSSKLQQ